LLLPRTLDSNLNNLIDVPAEQNCSVFQSEDSPPFSCREVGKLRIRIHTIFDQKMCEIARPFVASFMESADRTKKSSSKMVRSVNPCSDEVLDMMLLQK